MAHCRVRLLPSPWTLMRHSGWRSQPFQLLKKSKATCMPFPSPSRTSLSYLSQHTYIEEFIPKIGPYLHCLIKSEGVPATATCQSCKSAPFKWRCLDCFPALVLCKECCRKSHRLLPFHRVQKWSGKYFLPS